LTHVRDDRPVVLLMTTNGWGMGHLSRQLAIAIGLGDRAEPILVSLSGAVHLATAQGIRAEYLPSPSRGWLPTTAWNAYLAERLVALARETNATALVFDGVHPYRGVVEARRKLPEVAFVWSRRGMWTKGLGRDALRTGRDFDLIVEPGDLGSAADRGATLGRRDAIRVPPVSLLDVIPPLDRAEARAALGLDAAAPTALVSLSAGTGDPAVLLRGVLRAIRADPAWHVAVITNPLKPNPDLPTADPRVHPLADVYPLVRYLAAFDAAIASAGYNAAHELPLAGVPSLLVANTRSAWDDQVSRASGISERGLALWARDDRPGEVEARAAEVVTDVARDRIGNALGNLGLDERGGAVAVADLVNDAARGFAPGSMVIRPPRQRFIDRVRWTADGLRSAIARRRPRHSIVFYTRLLAFRLLRRPTASDLAAQARPQTFVFVEEPAGTPADVMAANTDRADVVLVTERLSRDVIAGAGPLEQLLSGSSQGYRAQRLDLARRFFPPNEFS
jgi:hypothetical protein